MTLEGLGFFVFLLYFFYSYFRRLKVLFSYTPEQDDELALQVGDIIDFVAEVEDGWWKGSLNGKAGIFPSNFVSELDHPVTNGISQGDTNKNSESRPVEKARGMKLLSFLNRNHLESNLTE